ncbi:MULTISPECIES: DUF2057 domain-containing protein [unclassified Salinivibrio]|uniref:YccT family protein n=1 Tax=unclassified Salinivibrio TaxID=2636825 RepID=UPI0012D1931E|nr:DUF2057 domain-containing protein [Salinivibrio sp. VYel7]MPX89791.1 DUF2057 domain-containing protein [Salinivibrio sp. VYel1]MPX93378.1 DUF2057 domain-containing protein [Salinivibrio sp. VYel9]MPX95795.1 DUF2057 domain-containing protein [Salinivibrio sp. VYel6]MPX99596.1 DUF2057 domain-containing protein [Salinivibrio sp. VYel4]MPY02555.1 DUF2057 domain-containing protein [Salinivibrio sp. VYel5]MPY05564.1 DUF2057 domain-containing protein [Salinivibrio sp. VYel8]MPY13649.1 DUF2057 do
MKKVTWFSALAVLLAAGAAQAATITSARNIEFLVADGKEVTFESWAPQQSIELSEGTHQLVMRFDGEVKRGSKEVIFTSRPYLFELTVDGRDATIGVSSRLRSQSQAKSYFSSGPQWQAEFENGDVMPLEAVELEGDGFGAYADMEALVAEYNRENGIIIDQGESKNLNDVLVEVDDQGKASIKGDALSQLKLWYTKASDQERKSFRRWIIDQD